MLDLPRKTFNYLVKYVFVAVFYPLEMFSEDRDAINGFVKMLREYHQLLFRLESDPTVKVRRQQSAQFLNNLHLPRLVLHTHVTTIEVKSLQVVSHLEGAICCRS